MPFHNFIKDMSIMGSPDMTSQTKQNVFNIFVMRRQKRQGTGFLLIDIKKISPWTWCVEEGGGAAQIHLSSTKKKMSSTFQSRGKAKGAQVFTWLASSNTKELNDLFVHM